MGSCWKNVEVHVIKNLGYLENMLVDIWMLKVLLVTPHTEIKNMFWTLDERWCS